jgi:hypothetical protein
MQKDKNRDPIKVKRNFHLFPLLLITAGVVTVAVCATISENYWDFLGLLLIISLASSLSGTVLGFLFGIPRLNRKFDPRDDYDKTTKYYPNTNLEDVSDWLTKIIIGVTLTQLTRIPGILQGIADNILLSSDCETMNCNFAKPMIISLIICFLIIGFMTGYFYTRLYLPNLFTIMEENRIKEVELSIWREGTQKGIRQSDDHAGTTRITSLSEDEIEILKTIKRHNNHFTGQRPLNLREHAAINVLVAKGIIEESRHISSGRRASLTITDNDLLQALN